MANATIKQLRDWSVRGALLAAVPDVGADRIDWAWRIVLTELLRHRPQLARTSSSALTTTTDQATVDLSVLPAGWQRDRLVAAYVDTDYELARESEASIRARRIACAASGRPQYMAIYETTALLYPTPDDAYALRWVYDELLLVRNGSAIVTWTDGADPTGIGIAATYTVNVDERWARMACFRGMPHVLLHADPDRGIFGRDWDRYVLWCMEQESEADVVRQVRGDII